MKSVYFGYKQLVFVVIIDLPVKFPQVNNSFSLPCIVSFEWTMDDTQLNLA